MKPIKELPALVGLIKHVGDHNSDEVPAVTEEEASRELVATNSMDVVNATAVRGRAIVKQVKLEHGDAVPESGHWWRWRFDVGNQRMG